MSASAQSVAASAATQEPLPGGPTAGYGATSSDRRRVAHILTGRRRRGGLAAGFPEARCGITVTYLLPPAELGRRPVCRLCASGAGRNARETQRAAESGDSDEGDR